MLPAMLITKSAPTVFTPLEDGTGVLLNLDTLNYYSLNHTGILLWKLLEEVKSVALEDLILLTCERFEVSEDDARLALLAFVDDLERYDIVRLGRSQ